MEAGRLGKKEEREKENQDMGFGETAVERRMEKKRAYVHWPI